MNMTRTMNLLAGAVVCLLPIIASAKAQPKAAPAPASALTAFSCGRFGPATTNSVSGDLGAIATAMFTTPGVNMPADFLEQGPWFLIDSYGSGPLMGCDPTASNLNEPSPRQNIYNQYGMLAQQKTLRSTGSTSTPATLNFKYLSTNPYLVSYAEQFCFTSVDTLLNRMTFQYTGNKLTRIIVVADSGCPNGGATYTYSYGSPVAPNLPSKVVIVNDQQQTATQLFTYVAAGGVLQTAYFAGGKITYSYTNGLMSQMNLVSSSSTTPLAIGYNPSLQWTNATDPRYHWGLTMTYQNGLVTKTLQDTGCPGFCQPSTFTYVVTPLATTEGACHVGSRQQHLAAGRIYAKDDQAFAKGSHQVLGPASLHRVDRLRERGPEQFYLDPSCR